MRIPPSTIPIGALLLACVLWAGRAEAQGVRGRVVDGQSGQAVAGAVVTLQDAAGARRDAALTDTAGAYTLRGPAGAYTVRVEHVGYAGAQAAVTLAGQEMVVVPLVATRRSLVLEPIVATSTRRQCTVRPENSAQAAIVWDEARKALSSAALAFERRRYRYRTREFRREVRTPGRLVTDSLVWNGAGLSSTPFRATPTDVLVAHGYVQTDGDSIVYHAPDAATLLSDAFLDHHCFNLREGTGSNAGMVGLEFAPLRGRRLPDVQGTLWLDRETARLRSIDYEYTGLEYRNRSRGDVGGRLEFAQAGDGGWFVRTWMIRMPRLQRAVNETVPQIVSLTERGGEVVEIQTTSGARVEFRAEP